MSNKAVLDPPIPGNARPKVVKSGHYVTDTDTYLKYFFNCENTVGINDSKGGVKSFSSWIKNDF